METLSCQLLLRTRNAFVLFKRMTHKVFVYGTLKRGEPNHHWLTDKKNGIGTFIAKGKTKEKYPLIIATKYNIPFLLYAPGEGHNVVGEIYEVDDQMLGRLDILEDHPNYYEREIDDIVVEEGGNKRTEKAWVYFLKKFKRELLSKEHLSDYSSSASHGLVYMERSKRDPNYNIKIDVRDSNNESTIDDLDDVITKK